MLDWNGEDYDGDVRDSVDGGKSFDKEFHTPEEDPNVLKTREQIE